jgi:hypothetical protein
MEPGLQWIKLEYDTGTVWAIGDVASLLFCFTKIFPASMNAQL